LSIAGSMLATAGVARAAAPDPAINYIYGSSSSDCASGDWQISGSTGTCLKLGSDASTYHIGGTPTGNSCPPINGFNGVAAQGPFGPVCVYFLKPSSLVTNPTDVTLGSSSGGAASTPQKVSADCVQDNLNSGNCQIIKYFTAFTKALSVMVGVVVTAMIIVGGIQYSAAGSDPQKVAAAKSKIINALLALVIFIFMVGFLQWLVPGGIF